MIGTTLTYLRGLLDAELRAAMPASVAGDALVVLPDGRRRGADLFVPDAVTLLVVGVDEQAVRPLPARHEREAADEAERATTLRLLLAARFADYGVSWTALDVLLQWFSRTPVHEPPAAASLPAVARVSFVLHVSSLAEQQALWLTLGAPYLPSLSCRAVLQPPVAP